MRKTKTIYVNLRCPKCHNPMKTLPKNKNLRCIYCSFECLKNECVNLKNKK